MRPIPPAFLENMQALLGDEYPAFHESFALPPLSGLRANTLKISPAELAQRLVLDLQPVPWSAAGFRLPGARQEQGGPSLSRHPYYAAGLYYIQEPSAMAVTEALAPQPGERLLDLCAAPGGKSTHLAALLGERGLLVANEIHPRRVWELAENLERWGTRNAVVSNESPARLAGHFGAFFDRVLVDAPCSGEGMFRKSESARRDWSPQAVESCALRQSDILDQAARLVRVGGWLAYSTCTFNPTENEAVVASLLEGRPDFELAEIAPIPGGAPGRPDWLDRAGAPPRLARAVRLWPHRCRGEGHFIALLRRSAGSPGAEHPAARPARATRGSQASLARRLLREFCQRSLAGLSLDDFEARGRLEQVGAYLYCLPHGLPSLRGLRLAHPGWWLGSLKGARTPRFEPSHALALGLQAGQARLSLDLDCDQARAYLRGQALSASGEEGWRLVTVDGFALGWGKSVGGRLKNVYPRGLRWL